MLWEKPRKEAYRMLKVGDRVFVVNNNSDYAGCEGVIANITERKRGKRWYWYAVSIKGGYAQPVFYRSSLQLLSDGKGPDPNLLFRRKKNGLSI